MVERKMERVTHVSTFIAVPAILAIFSALRGHGHIPATEYLVLPPLAVVIYIIFRAPFGPSANLVSIVLLPCAGAAFGELCYHYFGLTPLSVALCTIAVLALHAVLRGPMPPALALSVLALLLHADGPTYIIGVLEGTLMIAIVFCLWRRFVLTPLVGAGQANIRSNH